MTLLLVFVSWFFRLSVCVCVQAYVYTKNKQNQKERRKGDTTDELTVVDSTFDCVDNVLFCA